MSAAIANAETVALGHHAITELAESQASDQVIRDIAGHVSNRMLEHYSHIRMAAKRAALDALSSKRPTPAHGTNHGTKQGSTSRIAIGCWFPAAARDSFFTSWDLTTD